MSYALLDEACERLDVRFPIPIVRLYTNEGEIRIYANGVVEGCAGLVGIVNHISSVSRSVEALLPFSKAMHSAQSPILTSKKGNESSGGLHSVAATESHSAHSSDAVGEK